MPEILLYGWQSWGSFSGQRRSDFNRIEIVKQFNDFFGKDAHVVIYYGARKPDGLALGMNGLSFLFFNVWSQFKVPKTYVLYYN